MADRQLKDKAVDIKGKKYVLVSDRIQYLADNFDGKYNIETNYEYYPTDKMWVVKATLTLGLCTYTGLAQEIEGQGMVNKTSALENAETSAVGRACAMAGIGVIDSVASVDEINKANNRQAYIEKKAKDKEIMEDSPFGNEVKNVQNISGKTSTADKPKFEEKEFENLKLKMDLFDFDTAWKTIHEKYYVSDEYEKKVMEVYGKDSSALFN